MTEAAVRQHETFRKVTENGKDGGLSMAKITPLRLASAPAPTSVSGKVMPRRGLNTERRTREYLIPREAGALIRAAGKVGRHRHRDQTLCLVIYQHGLRAKEAVGLLWEQVDLELGQLHVVRVKHGVPGVHAMSGDEIRAWRRLKREQQPQSAHCFTTERKGPLTTSAVRKLVERAGRIAGLPFPAHVHMLRHGCGYRLAADSVPTREIQQHLGHKSISSTVVYTQLAPGKRYWR